MSGLTLPEFAERYAAAWCSNNAALVAAYYSERGSLTINDGPAAVGRAQIRTLAQSFMTAYPDLIVSVDRLEPQGARVLFHWSLSGTNAGPGGTRNRVYIQGHDDWSMGADGLIADSKGHYDAREWERQVQGR